MKKKIISLLLALCLFIPGLFLFTACGGGKDNLLSIEVKLAGSSQTNYSWNDQIFYGDMPFEIDEIKIIARYSSGKDIDVTSKGVEGEFYFNDVPYDGFPSTFAVGSWKIKFTYKGKEAEFSFYVSPAINDGISLYQVSSSVNYGSTIASASAISTYHPSGVAVTLSKVEDGGNDFAYKSTEPEAELCYLTESEYETYALQNDTDKRYSLQYGSTFYLKSALPGNTYYVYAKIAPYRNYDTVYSELKPVTINKGNMTLISGSTLQSSIAKQLNFASLYNRDSISVNPTTLLPELFTAGNQFINGFGDEIDINSLIFMFSNGETLVDYLDITAATSYVDVVAVDITEIYYNNSRAFRVTLPSGTIPKGVFQQKDYTLETNSSYTGKIGPTRVYDNQQNTIVTGISVVNNVSSTPSVTDIGSYQKEYLKLYRWDIIDDSVEPVVYGYVECEDSEWSIDDRGYIVLNAALAASQNSYKYKVKPYNMANFVINNPAGEEQSDGIVVEFTITPKTPTPLGSYDDSSDVFALDNNSTISYDFEINGLFDRDKVAEYFDKTEGSVAIELVEQIDENTQSDVIIAQTQISSTGTIYSRYNEENDYYYDVVSFDISRVTPIDAADTGSKRIVIKLTFTPNNSNYTAVSVYGYFYYYAPEFDLYALRNAASSSNRIDLDLAKTNYQNVIQMYKVDNYEWFAEVKIGDTGVDADDYVNIETWEKRNEIPEYGYAVRYTLKPWTQDWENGGDYVYGEAVYTETFYYVYPV